MDKKIEALTKVLTEFKEELTKNMNQSYGAADPNMVKDEPHKDDPNHEKKEKKIASKIKEEAEDLADMHKGSYGNEMACSENGQWYLKKDAANPALAPKEVKIKKLQGQIDAGTYKPDPKKIADKMVKSETIEEMEKAKRDISKMPSEHPIHRALSEEAHKRTEDDTGVSAHDQKALSSYGENTWFGEHGRHLENVTKEWHAGKFNPKLPKPKKP